MNRYLVRILTGGALLLFTAALPAADHYVSLSGGHVPPFTDWAGAATNIQAAIDAASAGETIWVTNGVYNTGGKVMAGDLTNRVALYKALTVQSVNGALESVIEGAWGTNGAAAVRCAWLTNGATLKGFTLRGGATRNSGDTTTLQCGGGAWGSSTNAWLLNCRLMGNTATSYGGGAYQAGLSGCVVKQNTAIAATGGGASICFIRNSLITQCSGYGGGGVSGGTLVNSTVVSNSITGSMGGGVVGTQLYLTNCIVWQNLGASGYTENFYGGTFVNCCTLPSPSGKGNITLDPKLLLDAHLAENSPCRGAGTNSASIGTDIDGQPWANPPSMGCDEWQPEPVVLGTAQPRAVGRIGEIYLTETGAAGDLPVASWWLKSGLPLDDPQKYGTNGMDLVIRDFSVQDAGDYQLVLSNSFGMATSSVWQVSAYCVDAASASPQSPFGDWNSAARDIQSAIDAASDSSVVMVTNGIYASGGRVVSRGLTNRVVLKKLCPVIGLNGPEVTRIQGAPDPVSTNGLLAVRGAWLGPGANIHGITVENGATGPDSSYTDLACGGGLYCEDKTSLIMNCVVRSNSAAALGGGVLGGTILNSRILGNNSVKQGGGVSYSAARNSLIAYNRATIGGGAIGSQVTHCTITQNTAVQTGGCVLTGLYGGYAQNSIIFGNQKLGTPQILIDVDTFESVTTPVTNSCVPGFSLKGNIGADPQLLDAFHLATTSPCRGAAAPQFATGTDLEGNPWANPPSMGCLEICEDQLVGPLVVGLTAPRSEVATGVVLPLYGTVSGRVSRVAWDFGDTTLRTNVGLQTSYTWTNAGNYTLTFTAYNNDHLQGVSATLPLRVVPLLAPAMAPGTWATNKFNCSFTTQWGINYIVEQTTNLAPPLTWRTVTNFVGVDGLQKITDPYATNTARFYRVRVP